MIIVRISRKFRTILSKHQIFRIFELFLMMVLSGFMEMISVALVVPFVQTVFSPDEVMKNSYMTFFRRLLGLYDYNAFLIFLAIFMAIVYFLKNAFLVTQVMIQERFIQNNRLKMQTSFHELFLKKDYEFYLSANSGDIVRIISNDIPTVFVTLTMLLSFFSESIVVVFLTITVIAITPLITIVLATLILFAVAIFAFFSRKIVKAAGIEYQVSVSSMYRILMQSIEGIKEVKITGTEEFLKKRYENSGKNLVHSSYINRLSSTLPKYLIETFVMCGLFLLLSILINSGIELKELVPAVSGIAMASIRLLPSANRIASNISALYYGESAVDKIIENKELLQKKICFDEENEHGGIDKKYKITKLKENIIAKNISYRYPTGTHNILNDAYIEIEKGKSIGFVGASGVGKTTLVDIILGILKPQKGEIQIDGIDIRRDEKGWLSQVGYISQTIFMLDGSIKDNVAFGIEASKVDNNRIWEVLKDVALSDFVESLPDGLDTQIGERGIRISGGQKQRIGIARALYKDPEIIFFDEATSSLDNETEAAIMESIEHLHGTKTMIIIAHRLSTIAKCDYVYRVQNGKIERER